MTPLAPLRILFTGMLGLIGLGLGIYCLWVYADEIRQPRTVVVTEYQPDGTLQVANESSFATESNVSDAPVEMRRVARPSRIPFDLPPWVMLVAGLLLSSLTLVGRWPLMWLSRMLSSQSGAKLKPVRKEGITIDRPDGTRLHVETSGNTNGPTIVFTHGWSLDSTAWHYAKQLLSDRFRLVMWDLPGLGRSQAPDSGNFEIAKMAEDLHAVVESVKGSKPVYLVGHSIGGMITQIYGGKYSETLRQDVAGIILVHTTYTNPLRTMLGAPLWSAIEKLVIVPSQYIMIAVAPLAWLSNWHSYFNGSMQQTTRLTSFTGKQSFAQVDYASWLSTRAWPAVIARGNLAMFRYDAQTALPSINVPTLVIGGKHDRITKPSASARIHELAPVSQTWLDDGGHLAIFEFHKEVVGQIALFVETNEAELKTSAVANVRAIASM